MTEVTYPIPVTDKRIDISGFAAWVQLQHGDQKRRDGSPYFGHCASVAAFAKSIGREYGLDEIKLSVVEAAGYGHDLFEDTRTDYEDVVKRASEEVAATISWVSDDKRLPVAVRHHLYKERLRDASVYAQIVKLADLHDNSKDSFTLFDAKPQPLRFLRRWQTRAQESLSALHQVRWSTYHGKVSDTLAELKRRLDELNVPLPTD